MFSKPFRVKSNIVIKGSDRRKLKADLLSAFPSLSPEDISELLPNKEELNVVKIYAHKGEAVTLYVLQKNPLLFELDKRLYPTVYLLWRYPALLPVFQTWPPVLQKLIGGADLMLPGVVVPSRGLPEVNQGDCCSVTLVNNRAPVAVGKAAVSTSEMTSLEMKGRGLFVLHTYMDYLWAFGDKSSPPSLSDTESEDLENIEKCEERQSSEEMDALLLQCFFHALKSKVRKSELPLLTSTFLRNHMFSCCPSGKQLDIKRSSYKKLSKFLQVMQQQYHFVRVKELSKGVESIVEVDWKNPDLRSFRVPEETSVETTPVQEEVEEESYYPPEITTLYSVSARVEPLFIGANKRKGATLHPAEVRSIITDYVKNNELVDNNNKKLLFCRTLGRMNECYQLVFPGRAPVIKKGHVEPIDISVASRGSNKKVTLIKNLEVYGLNPGVIASTLQHRVQASAVLQPVPGAKDRVLVQIQGNQVHQVGNLLLDHYHIARKYIQGLDKASKSGKKK
uniref:Eukaryotic translation initiation factor 2D n=1 Tax=Oryzias sinensis TaxID=183150 RepID=A0A8C7Z8U6_9TELE